MRYLILCSVVLFVGGLAWAESDNGDFGVKKKDTATFFVGSDKEAGTLGYTVDRIAKVCLAQLRLHNFKDNRGSGVTAVPCKSLIAYPEIKTFLNTGKTP